MPAPIDLSNFRVVKTGNTDVERDYINAILHAIVAVTDDLQTQIDTFTAGEGTGATGSVLTAVPEPQNGQSRNVTGEAGVVSTLDNGPLGTFEIGIVDGGIGALKFDVSGTPSATTVIQDDGTTLTYVERNAAIQWQEEGSNLGTAGSVVTVNFVGTPVTATRVGNVVTVTITGGSGGGAVNTVTDDGNFLVQVDNAVPTDPVVKLKTIATHTIVGNATGGSAVPTAMTSAQTTAILDPFTQLLQGLVAPPGLTPNTNWFLKYDGTWAIPGGGTATGTVTNFTAGNLSPIFTTSVATATSTPALTFALSNAAAHTYLGNNTGSAAAPAYVPIVAADLPALGANPSQTVGLSVVNGSAVTYLRSDGAPALSQAIAPTWSATHTFSLKIVANGGLESAAFTDVKAGGDLIAGSNTTGGTSVYGRHYVINPVGDLVARDVNGSVVDVWKMGPDTSPITNMVFKIGVLTPSTTYHSVEAATGYSTWPLKSTFSDIVHLSKITIVGGAITGSGLAVGDEIRCLVEGDWTITGWTLISSATGQLRVEVKKSTYSAYTGVTPATTMSGIVNAAGGIPRITIGNVKNTSTDVSGWSSVTLSDGDVLAILVNTNGASTPWYSLQLHGTKREH